MGNYLGLGKRNYHELMIRDYIFKGNTPKTLTFDVGKYGVIILQKEGCNI